MTKFSPYELHSALFIALDLMERAMCPFFLMKDTAKKIMENSDQLEPDLVDLKQIDLGVRKEQLTKEVLDTFESYAKDYRNDGTDISFMAGDVPVVVRIIRRNYEVFKRPDTVFYKIEEFKIPNPFDKYWNMRAFIR